ncbi:Germin-like protein 9-3 [Linum perenne]
MGGDPDILTDFVAPPNVVIDGSFFTFKGFEFLVNGTQLAPTFKVVKASKAEFPALDGQIVDTTNKLFTQTLQTGDMFVFPKGLVHFQYNAWNSTAIALSAFGSASAGTVSLPTTLFATNIDDTVLAKSFKTDVSVIQALKAGLAVKG